MPIGLTTPFAKGTGTLGYLATSSTELEATYYNLKALLLTNWGERPIHFNMGCNLVEFLFIPMDDETKTAVAQRVETQVAEWLPYVTLNSVNVTSDDQNKLSVEVDFSLRGRQDLTSRLSVSVSSGG